MALQSLFDRAHRTLTKRNPLLIDLTTERDHGRHPFPRHTLGPLQHGLDVDQLVPFQCSSKIPQQRSMGLYLLWSGGNTAAGSASQVVGKLHHTVQKLGTHAIAFWAIVHCALEELHRRLLWGLQRIPLRCEGSNNAITGLVGTAKQDAQVPCIFIDNSTRDILFLAPQIMITGVVIAPGAPTAR